MTHNKFGLLTLCLTFIGLMSFGFTNVPVRAGQLYTIAETVARDERLTTMSALLSRFEDIQTLLSDPAGAFTLLAPVDDAWTYVDAEGSEIDLTAAIADPVFAEALLRYSILPTLVDGAGYTDSPIDYGTMLPGYSITATYNDSMRTVFNDRSVEIGSIPVENGRLVLLDSGLPIGYFSEMGRMDASPAFFTASGVPLPEESDRSVTDVLTEAGDFTLMLRLFAAFPEVAQQLENGGLYTFIVPTDTALVDSGWWALLEQYVTDPALQSYALGFLEGSVWGGYFNEAALRRFVGQEGRTIRIQTLSTYGQASLNTFDPMSGTVDGVLRVNGDRISEQPLLANNVIIYVQEQLSVPG